MAKRIILFLLQFFAFGGLLYVGGNWDVINFSLQVRAMQTHTTAWNPIPVIKYPFGASHILIADGLLFAGILLVLILLVEALRKALKPWALISLLSFVSAVALALAMKVGLPPA